jgi:hypothetical protein
MTNEDGSKVQRNLISRISKLYVEAEREFEKYILHGGIMDFEKMDLIPADKVDPRNVNPRESLSALMESYKAALSMKELCLVYQEANFQEFLELDERIETSRKLAEIIMGHGRTLTDSLLAKLPEEITYLDKGKGKSWIRRKFGI